MNVAKYFYRIKEIGTNSNIGTAYLVTHAYGIFKEMDFLIPFFEEYKDLQIENNKFYELTEDDLIELTNRCNEVLEHHERSQELLPIEINNNTKYDEDYFTDIKTVKNLIDTEILPEFENLEEDCKITFFIYY